MGQGLPTHVHKELIVLYLITSDAHFRHDNVIRFERKCFDSVEAHDGRLLPLWREWLSGLSENDTFYFLGDLCGKGQEECVVRDILAGAFSLTPAKKVMIKGNHDKRTPNSLLEEVFDQVYDYPVYISDRVVLSHYPCAVYPSQVNVHGHTHGMRLKDMNHICASVHVNKYRPVTSKDVERRLGRCATWDTRFLYEPWAVDYQVTQERTDIITDSDNVIDLSASRLYHELRKIDRYSAE